MARTPTLVSTQQAADMLELTPGSFRSFRSRNPMTLIPYSIIDGKHFFKKTDVTAIKKTIRNSRRATTAQRTLAAFSGNY